MTSWSDAFAEGSRGRSTARLQEMRRLLDTELARRIQPAHDLGDEATRKRIDRAVDGIDWAGLLAGCGDLR